MHSIPLELPLKAEEAALLADIVLGQLEGRPLNTDTRHRFDMRASGLRLSSIAVVAGSLQRDPIHPSVYYLAVAPVSSPPMLLRIALAASPSSGLFPNALLIGRMRTDSGHEIVINAIPFGAEDRENIRTFAEQVDHAFLPRPQGALTVLEVETADAPAAFQAFRTILKGTGINMASVHADCDATLWAAVLAGWREGYTAATTVVAGRPVEAGYTKYNLSAADTRDAERIYNSILAVKTRRQCDFELTLSETGPVTTPEELAASLESLKDRGKPVQFIAPNLGLARDAERIARLAEVARQWNTTLTIRLTGDEPPEFLEQIGKATARRVNCRIAAGTALDKIVRLAEHLHA